MEEQRLRRELREVERIETEDSGKNIPKFYPFNSFDFSRDNMKISLLYISVLYLRSGRWWDETFCNGWPIDRVCRTWKYQPGGIPKARRCRILIARRGKLLGLISPLKLEFVYVLSMLFTVFIINWFQINNDLAQRDYNLFDLAPKNISVFQYSK